MTLVEANRRARVSGVSTVKYWLENDIDMDDIEEMPKPHFRPITYIKIPLLWAFFYLKKDYKYKDAVRDIISKGGST